MHLHMNKLLVAAAALALATTAGATTLSEKIDRTFDVRPGASLVLTNVNGRINVSSWDQPRIRVIAVKEVDGGREMAAEMMKAVKVEMTQRDGGLVVNTNHPRRNNGSESIFDWLLGNHADAQVRYDVVVPRNMNLDVSNTNGSIHVNGVTGTFDIDTTNGKIEVANCAGSIDASTTNGGIDAELVRVAKGQPLRFETTNGRIEVTVPRDVAANVDAGTTNGSIHTDLPIATTTHGRNSLRGAINGGGAQIRIRTTNGGIAIRAK